MSSNIPNSLVCFRTLPLLGSTYFVVLWCKRFDTHLAGSSVTSANAPGLVTVDDTFSSFIPQTVVDYSYLLSTFKVHSILIHRTELSHYSQALIFTTIMLPALSLRNLLSLKSVKARFQHFLAAFETSYIHVTLIIFQALELSQASEKFVKATVLIVLEFNLWRPNISTSP